MPTPIASPVADVIMAGISALPAVIDALKALGVPDSQPLCERLEQLLGAESALDAVARAQAEQARLAFTPTPTPGAPQP